MHRRDYLLALAAGASGLAGCSESASTPDSGTRTAVEEEIRTRHVGQPITEFRRDGRVLTVAGEVENSLIRLI